MGFYSNDFNKFLKSKNISSKYIEHYKNIATNFPIDDMPYTQLDVFNKLLKNNIILLSGDMDDHLCEIIKANILYLELINPEDDIKIYINSPGGSVYSGLGLLDTMEFVKNDIVTINTGLAASMAAIILCSGTKGKRKSLKRARTMIHQPLGYTGFAQASDIEIDAKEINSLKKELYEIISYQTGHPYTKVYADSDRDYWMSSSEAKKYGMIDEVIDRRK